MGNGERRGSFVRLVWAACLFAAGLNHVRTLLQHGLFWDYHGAPPASAAYLTSLTLIDPLTAILLIRRPRIGVPLTVLLIASNVAHNLALTIWRWPDRGLHIALSSPQMLAQIGFSAFVLATWRIARPQPTGALRR